MSTWNVKLRRRQEIIVVKQVLQRWPEYSADFPGMEILDTRSRRHALAYIDFTCSLEEWNQIGEGTKIVITFVESIVNPRVILPPKAPQRTAGKGEEDILPEGDYKWRCLTCRKKGGYDCDGTDDPKVIADAIYRAHREASPDCSSLNVKVFDKGMKIQEELMEFVRLKMVRSNEVGIS